MKRKVVMALCIFALSTTTFVYAEDTSNQIDTKEEIHELDSDRKLTMTEIGEKTSAVVKITSYLNGKKVSTGSGFLISDTGKIVTNYHVITGADKLEVTFDNGEKYSDFISVFKYDVKKDLAIIDTFQNNMSYLDIDDQEEVKIGNDIITIGSPYGYMNTMSTGIVSAIRDDKIQISAAISPGSSGGPLLNSKGKVVGVIVSGISEGENMGFAIPISQLNELKIIHNIGIDEIREMEIKRLIESRPKNFYVTSTSSGDIMFKWDEVEDADYYLVQFRVVGEEDFYNLESPNTSKRWDWSPNFRPFPVKVASQYKLEMQVVGVTNNIMGARSDVAFVRTNAAKKNQIKLDPYLEAAIKFENIKASDTLLKSDLVRIKELDLSNRNITNLEGIEYLESIVSLNLANNNIKNIYNLRKLKHLQELNIEGNKIKSIEPLSELRNLKRLDAHANEINDISPLGMIDQLRVLSLAENEISDVAVLEKLSNLEQIHIDNNVIESIESLSTLDKLITLSFESNKVSDISPIRDFHNMNDLRFSNNNVTELSALENMLELTRLEMAGNEISDISVVNNLKKIKILDISENKISDISPLNNLFNIDILWMQSNSVKNIDSLSTLFNLKTLYIDDNPIQDYKALDRFKSKKNENEYDLDLDLDAKDIIGKQEKLLEK